MSDDPRSWKCGQCGVILGLVRRDNDRRPKLDVLQRFVYPCDIAILIERSREAYLIVEMEQGTVRCGHCGAERTWHMGEQAMDDLIANRRKRRFGLEVA